MAKTPTDVFVQTCAWEVYVGAVGETFSNASTAIDTGDFTSLGVVQDDPTLAIDITRVKVQASNICGTVLEVLTDRSFSWKFDQAQFSKLTFENFFGAGSWATSGSGERWTPGTLAAVEKSLVFATTGSNGQSLRIMHPRVSITPDGNITWRTDNAVKLPIQITSLTPDSGSDIYIDANAALAAS